MADTIPSTPKLPPTSSAEDGDQVADSVGNVHIFNVETKEWVLQGQLEIPDIVSLDADGLVPPSIFRKLQLINQLRDTGIDFNSFRIDDKNAVKPYFYYFYSSDGFVNFIPETSNRLRMEVDRGKLYRRLLRNCIKGPKGLVGEIGQSGRDGITAVNEIFRTPSLDSEGKLNLTSEVSTPINTDVSLRFFNSKDVQVAELIIPLNDSGIDVTTAKDVVFVPTASEIVLNQANNTSAVVEASVLFQGDGTDDIDDWRFKLRQRGPNGKTGLDGLRRLEVVDQEFSDPLLRSTRAIVSLRKPNISNNIVSLEQGIFDEICVPRIAPPSAILPTGPVLDANFVAAQVSPNDCKDIGRFVFMPQDTIIQDLDIPVWTPTADCVDSVRFDQSQFKWYEETDPRYIFSILPTPRPPEQCCQEDFFFCPNVGDQPCGVSGKPTAPSRFNIAKASGRCDCECDSDLELQGDGLQFPTLGKNDENIACCSIRSQADVYNQSLVIEGKGSIKVEINWEDESPFDLNPDPCTTEGPDDPDEIVTSVTIETACIDISSLMETKKGFPAVYEFTVDSGGALGECPPCTVDLRISVNDTELFICRRYCVQVTFTCDCEAIPIITPPIITPSVPPPAIPSEEIPGIVTPDVEDPPAIEGPDDDEFELFEGDLDFRRDDDSLGTVTDRSLNIPDAIESGANDFSSNRAIQNASLQCVRTDIINVVFESFDFGTVFFPGGEEDPHDPLAQSGIVRPFTTVFDRTEGSLQDGPIGFGYYWPQSGSFNYIVSLNGVDVRRDTYSGGYLFFPQVTSAMDFPISGMIVSSGRSGETLRPAGSRWAQDISGIIEPGTSSFRFDFTSIDDIVRACGEGSNISLVDGTIDNIYSEQIIPPVVPGPSPETPTPELTVTRGIIPIANGGVDVVGDVDVGVMIGFVYTITNDGDGDLVLTALPDVSDIVNASVGRSGPPITTIGPGLFTTFTYFVTPTSIGAFSFNGIITTNDTDESPFIFSVTGTGVAPEMGVLRSATPITDGGSDVILATTKCIQTFTYTIENTGNKVLNVGTPIITPGSNITTATLSSPPASTVAPSGTTTFDVDIDPTIVAIWTTTISIPNNDSDESPYNFTMAGTISDPTMSLVDTTLAEAISNGGTHNLRGVESGASFGGRTFTFTITNSGNEVLNLTGAPLVAISSEVNVTATVSADPATTVTSGGGTTTFDVDVLPTIDGDFSFDVSIDNDDCDNSPWSFSLTGCGVPPETEYYWPFNDCDVVGIDNVLEYMGTTLFDGASTTTQTICSSFPKFGDAAVEQDATTTASFIFPTSADLDVSGFIDGIVIDYWISLDGQDVTMFTLLDSIADGITFDFQTDAFGVVDPLVTIDTSVGPISIDSDVTASGIWTVGDGYKHIRLFLDITSAAPEAFFWIDGALVGSAIGDGGTTFSVVDSGADLEFDLDTVHGGESEIVLLDNLAVFDIFPAVGTDVGTEDDFIPPTTEKGWITEGTL